jgi:hypothetical protein
VTAYVVLGKQGDGWVELARVDALNDQAAIRQALTKTTGPESSAAYVAVPARSFRPRRAVSQTRTVITLPRADEPKDAPA